MAQRGFPGETRRTHQFRQALYEELLEALLGAILEVDTYALDGLIQGEALRTLKRKDAKMLWQVCCWSWQHSAPGGCAALRRFMVSMRTLHPLLPLHEPTSPAPPFHPTTAQKTRQFTFFFED